MLWCRIVVREIVFLNLLLSTSVPRPELQQRVIEFGLATV